MTDLLGTHAQAASATSPCLRGEVGSPQPSRRGGDSKAATPQSQNSVGVVVLVESLLHLVHASFNSPSPARVARDLSPQAGRGGARGRLTESNLIRALVQDSSSSLPPTGICGAVW